jgi:hypothetical protein
MNSPARRTRQLPSQAVPCTNAALLDNNPPEARVLLGAAQTSIVFGPADAAPERAAAAVQISEALSILNSGNVIRALPCLDRAITWMQSSL